MIGPLMPGFKSQSFTTPVGVVKPSYVSSSSMFIFD